jgi:hypothetical protein
MDLLASLEIKKRLIAPIKKAALFKPPSWSIDLFGKGSPIGSNRRDISRPLFPWFSASSRRDISVRVDSLLKCKYKAKLQRNAALSELI